MKIQPGKNVLFSLIRQRSSLPVTASKISSWKMIPCEKPSIFPVSAPSSAPCRLFSKTASLELTVTHSQEEEMFSLALPGHEVESGALNSHEDTMRGGEAREESFYYGWYHYIIIDPFLYESHPYAIKTLR